MIHNETSWIIIL